ncbi:MAG: PSD1 domain-containing protein [Pirellulales bacterium]|nr:PSD1 domain-containing protein [Pirellulales bacterium]
MLHAPLLPRVRLSCALCGMVLLSQAWMAACTLAAEGQPEPAQVEFFEKHVRPLLVQNCYPCHSADAKEVRGGLRLDSRAGWITGGDSGPAVVPGDPEASPLIRAVRYEDFEMPPNGKLPGADVARLVEWVKMGAPDPRDEPPAAASPTQKPALDVEAAREFWSFRPLAEVEPPTVQDEAWCRTPIDRFILARLEAEGLRPTAPIEPRKLIRRVYFDLTGLPPSPEEVDSFVADPSPAAYEALVDRLLASPRYGERWGRSWLDLARFGESHGFEHDYDRPTAYHFRDYVIEALHQDLPYDTFVHWQLAGDELAPDNLLAMKGTGFLAAGVHSTQITKNQAEKERYDELDDMLSTTVLSTLGLTVGCARCHDHKFDPIPTEDYYRLLSTFTTTVRSEPDLLVDPEGYARAKEAFDREHAPFAEALATYEREQLPAGLADWEQNWSSLRESPRWTQVDPATLKSSGGATFERQADGSYLVTGTNADFDTYTLEISTGTRAVTGLRLEALSHPTLVAGGPGRAANGNIALSDVKLSARGAAAPVGATLSNPRATFEQKGLPVAAAIDGDAKSAWAVDPQFGRDHAAAFDVALPPAEGQERTLTLVLAFGNNQGHNIGRLRVALAESAESPALESAAYPAGIVAALDRPESERSAEERAALLAWFAPQDAGWQALKRAADEHAAKAPFAEKVKVLVSSEGVPAVRLHTQGPDFYEQTYVLKRGDLTLKDRVAEQGFLRVLTRADEGAGRWQATPPAGSKLSYRRTALAHWLTDVEAGAGHLAARVAANRLWAGHFGRGIVATPSDFGTQGARPTHPELLDWLARDLIAGEWRLKRLHKLLVTSATYQQGTDVNDVAAQRDPDNALWWRRVPHRLEAEAVRDALLATSGLLDEQMYGPGTLDQASRRRSIYFTVKRSEMIPFMQLFDAPDALQSTSQRTTTTIAPQALLMMNNPQVREYARGLAGRAAPSEEIVPAEAVTEAYRLALSRAPDETELADALAYLAAREATAGSAAGSVDSVVATARREALVDFCHALFCLNEFVYIE